MEHLNGTPVPAPGRASAPRLLPWPSPEGKPSYLVTDHRGGYLSRLADDLEATQLATGTDVLGLARTVLDDPTSPYTEVRYAGIRLAECLTDALRVAESRGLRLPTADFEDDEDASAFAESPDTGDLQLIVYGR
ncbi:hypothetical protein F3K40_17485 [Streptomyces sp. LBUM 1478]|uniref:hypothetical protein n=1 Tax=Streptomyces scabiei TaxID=1930 RepID=UPI0007658317|nr:hypothetical protein [Streptomyces scabiei]MBP5907158.1 hypothetical protein [Streptomyces sp. LBUM 1478]MBP5929993.1 hypothetical protein [Streptomyces sp. LBUM 1479]MDX3279850.1 hypothetical protein [Streptomyces scabiei]